MRKIEEHHLKTAEAGLDFALKALPSKDHPAAMGIALAKQSLAAAEPSRKPNRETTQHKRQNGTPASTRRAASGHTHSRN